MQTPSSFSTAALESKHGKFANLLEYNDWPIDEVLLAGGGVRAVGSFFKVNTFGPLMICFDSSYK